ncbi:hypothetical protein [Nocardioides sp. InS609-2]|uniref:hypothetical protein n=1 Tax=Nocardioides sp. InS609-2 TaxID=2760705 RepID=UPI0020BDC906|nr:hypothetical protein [Nocardioides sp. InS609-2]
MLILLRGLARDDLLARLQALGSPADPETGGAVDDLDTGLDAALRAARILEVSDDPDRAIDHLV